MAERNKATEKPPSFGEKLEHSKFVLVLMLLMVLAVSLIVMIIPETMRIFISSRVSTLLTPFSQNLTFRARIS